ncbi:uncharacterized protein AMSG_08755 [Thecamonas trahens ATCC 50062]|uniref:CAP-Gly domain-containing protein n=1 Tax=Thecamonas trahens ATCC 50062 TaxID=461836 RepID=A0A0L0DLY3_THETB|nr:hypothetical protein AMSG_08755 [Thecamonas trahens ATCC 50062]KNC53265.1 hypothetical protein AMSG_08755 [Thecamonas trahens ATCC 50062]|eukprot:XP_013754529.1 hypothetical protein AMSG_08755 [Thecamonas trahens ATCC 50062]
MAVAESGVAVGQAVLYKGLLRGVVRYVGDDRPFTDARPVIGVELETPDGKNNGSVDGTVYFVCAPDHGLFTKPKHLTAIDVPQHEQVTAPPEPDDAYALAVDRALEGLDIERARVVITKLKAKLSNTKAVLHEYKLEVKELKSGNDARVEALENKLRKKVQVNQLLKSRLRELMWEQDASSSSTQAAGPSAVAAELAATQEALAAAKDETDRLRELSEQLAAKLERYRTKIRMMKDLKLVEIRTVLCTHFNLEPYNVDDTPTLIDHVTALISGAGSGPDGECSKCSKLAQELAASRDELVAAQAAFAKFKKQRAAAETAVPEELRGGSEVDGDDDSVRLLVGDLQGPSLAASSPSILIPSPAPPPAPPPPGSGPPPPPPPGLTRGKSVPTVVPSAIRDLPEVPRGLDGKLMPLDVKGLPKKRLVRSFWSQDDIVGEMYQHLKLPEIHQLFGSRVNSGASTASLDRRSSVSSVGSSRSMSPTPAARSVLSAKRQRAVCIAQKFLKLSASQIKDIILNLDETRLTEDQTKMLLKLVPTAEEAAALARESAVSESGTKLHAADAILKELSSLPRLSDRIDAFILKRELPEQLASVQGDLDAMIKAIRDVTTSDGLRKLMALVLAVANYMNRGSFRGNQTSIQLDSLLVLARTRAKNARSGDGPENALDYVIDVIGSSPDLEVLLDLPAALEAVDVAAAVSTERVTLELEQLRRSFAALEAHLERGDMGEPFEGIMFDFVDEHGEAIAKLEPLLESIQKEFAELATSLGEDPRSVAPESLFDTLFSFLHRFKRGVTTWREAKAKHDAAAEALMSRSISNLRRRHRADNERKRSYSRHEAIEAMLKNTAEDGDGDDEIVDAILDPRTLLASLRTPTKPSRR